MLPPTRCHRFRRRQVRSPPIIRQSYEYCISREYLLQRFVLLYVPGNGIGITSFRIRRYSHSRVDLRSRSRNFELNWIWVGADAFRRRRKRESFLLMDNDDCVDLLADDSIEKNVYISARCSTALAKRHRNQRAYYGWKSVACAHAFRSYGLDRREHVCRTGKFKLVTWALLHEQQQQPCLAGVHSADI